MELAGQLLSLLFEDLFKKMCAELKRQASHELGKATARAELMASVAGTTILLRRLPRCVTDDPAALERALEARFPGRVHRVVVPRDGAESRARRKLATARARLARAPGRVAYGWSAPRAGPSRRGQARAG